MAACPAPTLTKLILLRLWLTREVSESAPDAEGVQRYKRETLRTLRARLNLDFQLAYGNAPTDICAYAEFGFDPINTFIIGPHAGEACSDRPPPQAPMNYIEHLAALRGGPSDNVER